MEPVDGQAPRRARPRDVRGVGFPSSGGALYGGRTLNALSQKVEIPFTTLDAETRRRAEEFIGCTLEQSYSEMTVELKNTVHRIFDTDDDHSRAARHRGHSRRRQQGTRRVT